MPGTLGVEELRGFSVRPSEVFLRASTMVRHFGLVWVCMLYACGGTDPASDVGSSSGGGPAVTGGAPSTGADPLSAAATCTSKTTWTRGENAQMRPGEACIACHATNDGPTFSIAGTVYPSGHEPNDCNGVPSSLAAVVVITDAQNKEYRLPVNPAGNFSLEQKIAAPYRAKVVTGAKERAMVTQQSVGDCNSCHTQTGANGAPGRITAPL